MDEQVGAKIYAHIAQQSRHEALRAAAAIAKRLGSEEIADAILALLGTNPPAPAGVASPNSVSLSSRDQRLGCG